MLHTSREGLAARVGHDLTISVDDWTGVIEADQDIEQSRIDVSADLSSLRVLSGTGGAKPLSEKDKREITANAGKALAGAEDSQAKYVSTSIAVSGSGGVVHGELTINGRTRPVDLSVDDLGGGRYKGAATIVQTDFGIKPFSGMFGALRLADDVGVSVEVALS